VRRVALTHHDPAHDDDFVADIEPQGACAGALQGGTDSKSFAHMKAANSSWNRISLEAVCHGEPFPCVRREARFHILVVDDQPDALILIVRALERESS